MSNGFFDFNNNPYTKHVQEHIQHSMEYGKNLMSTAHDVQSEITKKFTDVFAHNISLGKSFLDCKKVDHVVDWCHHFVNSNVNHAMDGATSIISKTCDQVSKANSEIAKKVGENFANIKDKFHK